MDRTEGLRLRVRALEVAVETLGKVALTMLNQQAERNHCLVYREGIQNTCNCGHVELKAEIDDVLDGVHQE